MNYMINYPKVGKLYKHYKGGIYRILTLAKHSETQDTLVIYQSTEFGSVYARPLEMWFEDVNKSADEDGRVVYRFILIEEQK